MDISPAQSRMDPTAIPISTLFLAIGAGALTLFAWRRAQAPTTDRFSKVDESLRKALKEEDQKSTPFPKEVDLEPGFE